ncbi:DNA/RNA helicase domain-containing protein [Blautia producta]|uniref:DNA/RNA helicase domain-containing protein n=1 Tax=Blautia producta TaxID=33035 RepID=UPI000494E88C
MDYVRKTVFELLEINTHQRVVDFIRELIKHSEKRLIIQDSVLLNLVQTYYKNQRVTYAANTSDEKKKVMSWIDCLEFLQRFFAGKSELYGVKLCFEYHTPDNAWFDVVVLDNNRITILEFKSGESTNEDNLSDYEEQLDAYCNKMSHANVSVWQQFEKGLQARGFLVYTSEKMKNIGFQEKIVKVCEEFAEVVDGLSGTMDDVLETAVMNFDPDLDSSTLSAFINVLDEKVLDGIYIPDICKDRCIDIIDEDKDAQVKNIFVPKVNIIFVNGKPGSGKTGVALSLVSEYCKRRIDGKSSKRIRYATGNGNLYSLFNQAARNKKTAGTTAFVFSRIRELYKIDDIINNPSGHLEYRAKTKEDIIIIDEAQRMWSSEKIAFDHSSKKVGDQYINTYHYDRRTVLANGLSEPVMVLRDIYKGALESNKTKTVLFLIGNGQEIYTGEELGEDQIVQAIDVVSKLFENKVITRVYSSKQYEALGANIQDSSEENRGLFLHSEKRNKMCCEAGAMVDALLNNEKITTSGNIPFVVLGTKKDLNTKYFSIKKADPKAKQRLFIDSYDQKDICTYFETPKVAIKNTQLFDFFMNDLGAKMDYFATEFNAQGLETDYVYFVWGRRIKRIDNGWDVNTRNAGQIYYYYKEIEEFRRANPDLNIKAHNINEEIHKMIINAFRVLLTRAQKKTFIYVEDEVTRKYLLNYFSGK